MTLQRLGVLSAGSDAGQDAMRLARKLARVDGWRPSARRKWSRVSPFPSQWSSSRKSGKTYSVSSSMTEEAGRLLYFRLNAVWAIPIAW